MMYRDLFFGPIANFPTVLLVVLAIWDLVWRGIALWKSARNNQQVWFIALLVLSTAGILPIIYLAFFQKKLKVSKR